MASKHRLRRIEQVLLHLADQPIEPGNPFDDVSPQEWLQAFEDWSADPEFARHHGYFEDLRQYRNEVGALPDGVRHRQGIGPLRFHRDKVLIWAVGIWDEQAQNQCAETPPILSVRGP